MKNIDIKYGSDFRIFGLIIISISAIATICFFLFDKNISLAFAGGIVIAILIELYKMTNNYITVKDGFIKKDFGSKLKLDDVKVKKYTDSYTFSDSRKEITVDTKKISKKSLDDFKFLVSNLENNTANFC